MRKCPPLCVSLRYAEVIRESSCFRVTVTSKKESVPITSFSRVNFIEAYFIDVGGNYPDVLPLLQHRHHPHTSTNTWVDCGMF